MKLLLIVGSSNDVFISNMAKWLKHSIAGLTIDVFEFYPSDQQLVNTEFYDSVETVRPITKIWKLWNLIQPFYQAKLLDNFLTKRHYDIIQCHWIVPPVVLATRLKDHCDRLYATFWGGEYHHMHILYSNRLYKYYLKKYLASLDCIINSPVFYKRLLNIFPDLKCNFHEGHLGSEPLGILCELMKTETKKDSKIKMGIPTDKISILVGYSGKKLHQHLDIIQSLNHCSSLHSGIHFLLPMTRGASADYINEVETALSKTPYTFTLIKDCFMSDQEIARLRNATDIVLQLSTTDGFSRSIVECLCAGSILIYGGWLKYEQYMKNEGYKGIAVESIADACKTLTGIVGNLSKYEELYGQNSQMGIKKNLWQECIKDWVSIYNREN